MWRALWGDKKTVLNKRAAEMPGWQGVCHLLVLYCTVIWKAFRTRWGHVLLLLIKDFCFLEDTGVDYAQKKWNIFQGMVLFSGLKKCLCKSHPHEKEGSIKGISVKIYHMESLGCSLILPLLTHPSTHPLPFPISGESQYPIWGLYVTPTNLG